MKPSKLLSFILGAVMTISSLPAFTLTAGAASAEKNITLGTSALKGAQAGNVYFGSYQQSEYTPVTVPGSPVNDKVYTDSDGTKFVYLSKTKQYYRVDPIKWRVLDNAHDYNRDAAEGAADTTKSLFLASDQNLEVFQYHTDYEVVTWEKSTMRSWLNGYNEKENNGDNAGMDWEQAGKDKGIDYSSNSFIGSAFSDSERSAIVTTAVVNKTDGNGNNPNPAYPTPGGEDTQDRVFLLSITEITNPAYGFADHYKKDDTRVSTNTAYTAAGGKSGSDISGVGEGDSWWLRSPGDFTYNASFVIYNGAVDRLGDFATYAYSTVRPAFNLNQSSVLFTSAAKGGKSSTIDAGDKTNLSKNTDFDSLADNDGYKLTLLDSSREFAAAETEKRAAQGQQIEFAYSNAKTGANEYISAMITDANGDVIYYGQLENPADGEENGTVSLTVPSDIAGGEYTLKLFNEQINGDYKTDFSSKFVDISLSIDGSTPSQSDWENPFTDVTKADWFFDSVKYASENGLMSGTDDTEFAPQLPLTRGMLTTVLYRLAGEPGVNKSIPFADVKADSYYTSAVIWAQQNGIVSGVSENEFAPDENITREQIAAIIYRYAKFMGTAPTGAWAIKLDYADINGISDYAAEGVMYCTLKGIMQGKDNNMFAPKENAARAEIAAILQRFIENSK